MRKVLLSAIVTIMPVMCFSEPLDYLGVEDYSHCYGIDQTPPLPKDPSYSFEFPGEKSIDGKAELGPYKMVVWRQQCKVLAPDGSSTVTWSGNALYFRIFPTSNLPVAMQQEFVIQQGRLQGRGLSISESRAYKIINDVSKGNPQVTPFGGLLGVFITGFDPDKEFELSLVDGPDSTRKLKTVKVPASEGWVGRVKRWFK